MPSAMSIAALIWAAVLGAAAVAECHAIRSPGSTPNILVVPVAPRAPPALELSKGSSTWGMHPINCNMTRDASRPKMRQLQKKGFGVVQGDLQRPSSLRGIGKGCGGCCIHATGGDTKELDTTEVSSAKNLCDALHKDVTCIVYNSAAGAEDHGVERIQQKHDVETILSKRGSPCHVTSLRANIFGEELWKGYTRPQILDGKYPLPVHRWRKIYVCSVRDMGRLAGRIIERDAQSDEGGTIMRIMNVAGDRLTGPQLARAFGKAQQSKCKHVNNREMTKMAKENFPDLYEQIVFLQTSKEKTNIRRLRREFPGLVTSFNDFLEETRWGDRERVFEDLSDPESLVFGDGALATESV